MAAGKNIVLCSDGTGNTMMKGRGTNVWKLYEAVDLTGHRWSQSPDAGVELGREQVAFYDDGVGSEENRILKIVGGAFGYGLKRNVRDLYKSLCRAYLPGDQIFIFGFSRGAYTARVLAGLILSCGILKREYCVTDKCLDQMSRKAYKAFRAHFRLGTVSGHRAIDAMKKAAEKKAQLEMADTGESTELVEKYESSLQKAETASRRADSARKAAEAITNSFRNSHSISHPEYLPEGVVGIRFVGVWDTVAAVGLPFKWLTDFWNRYVYPFKFPDYELSPNVEKGCHALAIDDERLTFHPMMWDERREDPRSGHIEQVWFAGVHSNVGGGYPKQGMSLVTLDWMMHRAEEKGLVFVNSERERYRHLQNVHDKLYDSRSGLATYYRYAPRDIDKTCREFGIEPKVHVSVMERIAIGTQDYAPGNLPAGFTIATTDPNSTALIENAEKLEEIRAALGPWSASEGVSRWITVRKHIYLAFLALTAIIVTIAARHRIASNHTETWVPDSWDAMLMWLANLVPFGGALYEFLVRPFLIYWYYALLALLLFALFYALRELFKQKLHNAFANYWRRKIPAPWW